MQKYNSLGQRIKVARQKCGFSQAELARLLNCTQAALSQYERGVREPSLGDLGNIANALNTSTDYLLGRTEILSNDMSKKKMGDYLGLSEKAIDLFHEMYATRKIATDEHSVLEELKFFSNASPTDDNYIMDYNFIKRSKWQDLVDYQKALNEFICSQEFWGLISRLVHNLYLERSVYDLLRIADKQYDRIETFFSSECPAEQAYSLAEEGEDNIKLYSLNMYEIQSAIMGFCQKFTKLEEIKKHEQSEHFYRKVVVSIYLATHPMFEKGVYSVEKMDKELDYIRKQVGSQIEALLRNA
ncbi:MAG: helix-turn-helix transcriptional regulator [Clostridia bacterium]|nr:helix-turn-helix transcriptional regulator [Clostridia bacterium]